MIFEYKVYGYLCAMEIFKINGVDADCDDFGEKEDQGSEYAHEYCCGNMQFTRYPAKQEVLDKYGITLNDYNEICDVLEEKLSFGECGWCS